MQENLKNQLIEKWLSEEIILNALDTAEDILAVGGMVTEQGEAVLYHRTSKENARKIIKQQYMLTKEDCIYFSTCPNGQIEGYGDCCIKAYIPLEQLVLDDEFSSELHYKVMTGFRKGCTVKAELL